MADGVDAVRVERLAATMRVTKGSFYWHFKDRGALLAAVLSGWQAQGGTPADRLCSLLTIIAQDDGRLDQAIRFWSAQDAKVRSVQRQVDERRPTYLDGLFRDLGFARVEASARARLVYHALIEQFIVGASSTLPERLADCLDIVYPILIRKK